MFSEITLGLKIRPNVTLMRQKRMIGVYGVTNGTHFNEGLV